MKGLRLAVALLLSLSAASHVEATTAVALSNRALADGADVIATGRCVALTTVWEGRRLVTVATVTVSDILKGEAAGSITVALPGGIDAQRRIPVSMSYAGAPQMRVGEDVFLFLTRSDSVQSGLVVMGFSQGKFSIVPDDHGSPVVARDLTLLTLQSPAGTQRGTASRVSLAAFKREVREHLARR